MHADTQRQDTEQQAGRTPRGYAAAHHYEHAEYARALRDLQSQRVASSHVLSTAVDAVAHGVLVLHQRYDIGSCLCGWGTERGQLGKSHAVHVVSELRRAGVLDG